MRASDITPPPALGLGLGHLSRRREALFLGLQIRWDKLDREWPARFADQIQQLPQGGAAAVSEAVCGGLCRCGDRLPQAFSNGYFLTSAPLTVVTRIPTRSGMSIAASGEMYLTTTPSLVSSAS